MTYRTTMGDLSELMHSIHLKGQLHPILITPKRVVVWGSRRKAACERLGIKPITKIVRCVNDVRRYTVSDSPHHLPLTWEDKLNLAALLRDLEKPHSIERQKMGQRRGGMASRFGVLPNELPPAPPPQKGLWARIGEIVAIPSSTLARAMWMWQAVHDPQEENRPDPQVISLYREMVVTGKISACYEKARGLRSIDLDTPAKPTITDAKAQRRAMSNAAIKLAGICMGLEQIEAIADDITPVEAAEFKREFWAARKTLETLIKELKIKENA